MTAQGDNETADFPLPPTGASAAGNETAAPHSQIGARDEGPDRAYEPPTGAFADLVSSLTWQVTPLDAPIEIKGFTLTGTLAIHEHSVVFAGQRWDGESVVVKVVRQVDGGRHDELRARLRREHLAGVALNRMQSFAEVFDLIELVDVPPDVYKRWSIAEGTLALVQQSVTGPTLVQVRNLPLLDGRDRVVEHIAWQLLAAQLPMRANGVRHQDIKPANVALYAGTLDVALLDLGACHLEEDRGSVTQYGNNVGTLRYASLEQLKGQELTPASDIHAWAVTIAEVAAGSDKFPYKSRYGENGMAANALHNGGVATTRLSGALKDAVLIGLSPDGATREEALEFMPEYYRTTPRRRQRSAPYLAFTKQRAAASFDQASGTAASVVAPPAALLSAEDEPELVEADYHYDYGIASLRIDQVRAAARRKAQEAADVTGEWGPPRPPKFSDRPQRRARAWCVRCGHEVVFTEPRPTRPRRLNAPLAEPPLVRCFGHHEQLAGREANRDVTIALIGDIGASKTTYLTALFDAIVKRGALRVFGFDAQMPTHWQEDFERRFWVPLMRDKVVFEPTKNEVDNVLGVRLVYTPDPDLSVNLTVIDVAGERLNDQMRTRAPYVGRTNAAIFLVESEALAGEAKGRKRFPVDHPGVVQAVRNSPGVTRSDTYPVAVAITKADRLASAVDNRLLEDRPELFTTFVDLLQDSALAQDALEGLGRDPARQYMTTVEETFEPPIGHQGVTYHLIAPTGHPAGEGERYAQVTPFRCLDPVLSVMYRKGRLRLLDPGSPAARLKREHASVARSEAARERAVRAKNEREKAEREAQEGAEREAQDGAEREAQEGAEREAQEGAEREAQNGAEREAQDGAEREAQEGAEREAQGQDHCGATTPKIVLEEWWRTAGHDRAQRVVFAWRRLQVLVVPLPGQAQDRWERDKRLANRAIGRLRPKAGDISFLRTVRNTIEHSSGENLTDADIESALLIVERFVEKLPPGDLQKIALPD